MYQNWAAYIDTNLKMCWCISFDISQMISPTPTRTSKLTNSDAILNSLQLFNNITMMQKICCTAAIWFL